MKLADTFESLNKGVKRIISVLSILIAVILAIIVVPDEDPEIVLLAGFFFLIVVWILIYICLWIYDGLINDKKS